MSQAPLDTVLRIKKPYDKSVPKDEVARKAQRLREGGAENVRLEKDPATGGWILFADYVPLS